MRRRFQFLDPFPDYNMNMPIEDPFAYIERVEYGLQRLKDKYKGDHHHKSKFGTTEWLMILFSGSTLIQTIVLITVVMLK